MPIDTITMAEDYTQSFDTIDITRNSWNKRSKIVGDKIEEE